MAYMLLLNDNIRIFLITIVTTKGVLVRQVISLDFEWIHWSSEQGLMNCTHIL